MDPEQRFRLNQFDLVVPDGQPVRWALNLLHSANLSDRVYGPTLMLKLCERCAKEGLPIYLYGSNAEVLGKLRQRLQAQFPALRIAGAQPSRFRRVTAGREKRDRARTSATAARESCSPDWDVRARKSGPTSIATPSRCQ